MADEFPDDLPIAPGITVGDWRRAQALRTDQSVQAANDAKLAEAQKPLDQAKGTKAGRELANGPMKLDAARAQQKLNDIPHGPRDVEFPRTVEATRYNDYLGANTIMASPGKTKTTYQSGRAWSTDGRPLAPFVDMVDTLHHMPGRDITLEQADQLYHGPTREKALAEWQRERDKQSRPMTNAGAKAVKGLKRVQRTGGAGPDTSGVGESAVESAKDVVTPNRFSAPRPSDAQQNWDAAKNVAPYKENLGRPIPNFTPPAQRPPFNGFDRTIEQGAGPSARGGGQMDEYPIPTEVPMPTNVEDAPPVPTEVQIGPEEAPPVPTEVNMSPQPQPTQQALAHDFIHPRTGEHIQVTPERMRELYQKAKAGDTTPQPGPNGHPMTAAQLYMHIMAGAADNQVKKMLAEEEAKYGVEAAPSEAKVAAPAAQPSAPPAPREPYQGPVSQQRYSPNQAHLDQQAAIRAQRGSSSEFVGPKAPTPVAPAALSAGGKAVPSAAGDLWAKEQSSQQHITKQNAPSNIFSTSGPQQHITKQNAPSNIFAAPARGFSASPSSSFPLLEDLASRAADSYKNVPGDLADAAKRAISDSVIPGAMYVRPGLDAVGTLGGIADIAGRASVDPAGTARGVAQDMADHAATGLLSGKIVGSLPKAPGPRKLGPEPASGAPPVTRSKPREVEFTPPKVPKGWDKWDKLGGETPTKKKPTVQVSKEPAPEAKVGPPNTSVPEQPNNNKLKASKETPSGGRRSGKAEIIDPTTITPRSEKVPKPKGDPQLNRIFELNKEAGGKARDVENAAQKLGTYDAEALAKHLGLELPPAKAAPPPAADRSGSAFGGARAKKAFDQKYKDPTLGDLQDNRVPKGWDNPGGPKPYKSAKQASRQNGPGEVPIVTGDPSMKAPTPRQSAKPFNWKQTEAPKKAEAPKKLNLKDESAPPKKLNLKDGFTPFEIPKTPLPPPKKVKLGD